MNIFDKLKAAEAARLAKAGTAPPIPPERKALSDKLNKPSSGVQFLRAGAEQSPPADPKVSNAAEVSSEHTHTAESPKPQIAAADRPVVSHGSNFQPARPVPLSMTVEDPLASIPSLDELEDIAEFDASEDEEEFGEMAEIDMEDAGWPQIDLDERTGESLTIRELTQPSAETTPSALPSSPMPSSSTVMKRLTLPPASQPIAEKQPPEPSAPPQSPSPKPPLLRLPGTPALRLPPQPSNSPPPQPSATLQPQPASAPTTKPISSQENALIAAGGPLGKLLERKYQSPNTAITAGAAACVEAGSGDVAISPQQFLDEWNALGDDPELVENLNEQRVDLLRRVCARLQQIFTAEMDKLTTVYANERSLQELSQLVRLTFIRVKEAPSAWATLDRTEKGAVIQAMAAMAVKRNSAVRNRKSGEAKALSASMETMIVGEGDVLNAFDEVFGDVDLQF